MDYRQKFKCLRLDLDLTQQQIADICDVSDATVGHWEHLKRDMKVDSIVKLCRFYNVSPEYILGFTDDIKPLSDKK